MIMLIIYIANVCILKQLRTRSFTHFHSVSIIRTASILARSGNNVNSTVRRRYFRKCVKYLYSKQKKQIEYIFCDLIYSIDLFYLMKNTRFLTNIINVNKSLPEFFDTPAQKHFKINRLVQAFHKHSSCLLITGAGISTASGIPDYRSPENTSLKIGAGQYNRSVPLSFKPVTYATPSFTHLAITQLMNSGKIKTLITQNVDNLHLKALTTNTKLIQIHGNVCKQYCQSCQKLHYRNFYCRDRNRQKNHDHFNGRYCQECGGRLLDSLVFFGESYKPKYKELLSTLNSPFTLVVGSSLNIPSMQRLIKRLNSQVHIINIQKVNLEDNLISNHIHCESDQVFKIITQKLYLKVKQFKIIYNMRLKMNKEILQFAFFDFQYTKVDCVKLIQISNKQQVKVANENKYSIGLDQLNHLKSVVIHLHSYHQETPLELSSQTLKKMLQQQQTLKMSWDPRIRQWGIEFHK